MIVDIKIGEAELAYAAGVIDSDGTIGIKRNSYSMRVVGDSSAPTYSIRIKVKQVQPEAVRLLKACFGGALRIDKPSGGKGRPLYSWEIRDQLAENMLVQILRYLRIKRGQAHNCLDMRDLIKASKAARVSKGRGHVGAAHRPAEISDKMEALFCKAKSLNVVGVQP